MDLLLTKQKLRTHPEPGHPANNMRDKQGIGIDVPHHWLQCRGSSDVLGMRSRRMVSNITSESLHGASAWHACSSNECLQYIFLHNAVLF